MTCQITPVTLGERIKSLEVGGFILTETKHPPTLMLPRHAHEHASILFVLKGSFTENIGGSPQECGSLSLLMKPAREIHSDQYGRVGAQCLIIEVKPPRLEMIRPVSKVLDRAAHVRGGMMSALAMRIYKEFHMTDSASLLSIEALTLEMLAQATRQSFGGRAMREPRWLGQARDLIHEQFSQRVSLFTIAEAVGVHPAHLAKVFRKHYHCTVGDYVRRLRLDYAVQELTQSGKSLAEIALAAGFYDQSHFTHVFKLHMRLTPAEFRAAAQANKAGHKRLRFSKIS
jgi:AraC family transcriptional regulator